MANSQTYDSDYDDDDDGGQPQLPNQARQHLRKLERENADLKQKLDKFLETQRTDSLAAKVKAKGYDPLVLGLVPSTVDAEGIDKWLEDHSKILAKATSEEESAGGEEGTGGITQEQMAAMQNIANASAQGIVPVKPADLMAQMTDPSMTEEKLLALLRSQGAKV